MKEKIHPKYDVCLVSCTCGNTFYTRSTLKEIKVGICSNCHPFFTGKQKLVDVAGRVEKFKKRYAKTGGRTVRKPPKVSSKRTKKKEVKKKESKES